MHETEAIAMPVPGPVLRRAKPGGRRSGRRLLGLLLWADGARPLRFALTGGTSGLIQIGLLAVLVAHGWPSLRANLAAFLMAAQVNFALSTLFTWSDRRVAQALARRWLLFHCSIAGMAALNMLVFAACRTWLPDLAAAACGIVAAAAGNYALGDRLVFRDWHRPATALDDEVSENVA